MQRTPRYLPIALSNLQVVVVVAADRLLYTAKAGSTMCKRVCAGTLSRREPDVDAEAPLLGDREPERARRTHPLGKYAHGNNGCSLLGNDSSIQLRPRKLKKWRRYFIHGKGKHFHPRRASQGVDEEGGGEGALAGTMTGSKA